MSRLSHGLAALVLCAPCLAAPAAPPAIELPGRIDTVTVYRGQALVTRVVDIPGPAGLREVIVTGLPAHALGGSIHAESANGVEVRSVLYRVRPVEHDVREEVRQLDEQIRAATDQLAEKQKLLELIAQRKAYLDKLEQFVAPTATVELTQGVLNAETLEKLTTMLADRRREAATEELELNLQSRDLKARLDLLARNRQELTSSSAKSAREAVVFVNLGENGGKLRLRYLVNNANWSPSYNARARAGHAELTVEVNASVQQTSGEDWTDVDMTLSTVTPSLVAKAPTLTPMAVSLVPGGQQQAQVVTAPADYKQARKELMARQSMANATRNFVGIGQSDMQQQQQASAQIATTDNNFVMADLELNRLANEIQNLDLLAEGRIVRDKSAGIPAEDVAVTYAVGGRISLPSRSDRQLIQVAALPLEGEFYKVATPLLTAYVYNEASVTNAGELVLLAGPVSTYLGGQFVGHGEIPNVAVGERFNLGFGVDSSLRAGRELAEKSDSIQGGNRVTDLTYRLAIENFGTTPARVRLYDRMPQTQRSDIKISLTSNADDLSTDARYRQSEFKKNILRWEVDVPAQAIGPDAKSVSYQFRLEYDKQMTIAGLALAQ